MMKTLTNLLHDTDPIHYEPPPSDARWAALRQQVIGSRPESTPERTRVPRRVFATGLATAVAALAYVALSEQTGPAYAAVRFEVRLAETQPAPGLVVAQVPDSTELIYLHSDAIAGNDDIVQTFVTPDGTRFSVGVELSQDAGERMRRATSAHVGRPVAILIDGTVVMAPTVRGAIGSSAMITGDFSYADAERIANGMRPR
jgi:preprotein translocase subunit SecD